MNIKSVIKRLFHCFCLFVDIKRSYFDNIEIVPIILKTWKKLYGNWIEIFGIISRSSNFIWNWIYSNQIESYLIGFLCRFFKIDHAWCPVSFMLSVAYAECRLCWVFLVLSVAYDECLYAECHYAECRGTLVLRCLSITICLGLADNCKHCRRNTGYNHL